MPSSPNRALTNRMEAMEAPKSQKLSATRSAQKRGGIKRSYRYAPEGRSSTSTGAIEDSPSRTRRAVSESQACSLPNESGYRASSHIRIGSATARTSASQPHGDQHLQASAGLVPASPRAPRMGLEPRRAAAHQIPPLSVRPR